MSPFHFLAKWILLVFSLTTVSGLTTPTVSCAQAPSCIHWYADNYVCSNGMATCEYMKCVCKLANYDFCSCLPHVGTCLIEQNSIEAKASATYEGASKSVYSCIPTEINPTYNVYIIGNYENINARPPQAGNTEVSINIENPDNRPIILVFSSYEPVNWKLSVTDNVVIDTVILISYYLDESNVIPIREGSVRTVVRNPNRSLFGYGSDSGGGNTAGLLEYVQEQYGSIASFTGCYKADRWSINIQGTGMLDDMIEPEPESQGLTTKNPELICPQANACIGGNYCSGGFATCENSKCLCRHENYDTCTCLPHVGTCLIEENSIEAKASASYGGASKSVYSCTPTEINPTYTVHIIGNYENINARPPRAGNTEVFINVENPDNRPIILVFSSYEPVNWKLRVTDNVVIDTVILVSYYLDESNITPLREGSVRNIIRHPERGLFGYGSDTGGGHTADLLVYVQQEYGSIASFTGCYKADYWNLYIQGAGIVRQTTEPAPGSQDDTQDEEQNATATQSNLNTLIYVVAGVGGLIAVLLAVLIIVLIIRRGSSPQPGEHAIKGSTVSLPTPLYQPHRYEHALLTISGTSELGPPPIYSEIGDNTEDDVGYITVIN